MAEAETQDAIAAPRATVHAAYYAMFHAARAVLLRTEGTAPKKHASVVGQFGLVVKERGQPLRQAGSELNKVEAFRIKADYSDEEVVTPEEALQSLQMARRFLELCAREFGFPRAQEEQR
jgi:uncharacterized protein (UPF0332 family)